MVPKIKDKKHIFSKKFGKDTETEAYSETQKNQMKYQEAPVTVKRLCQGGINK